MSKEIITKFCENCGNEFQTNKTKRGVSRRFCTRKCSAHVLGKNNTGRPRTAEWKKMMSLRNSGENNPFYNRKHSEDSKSSIGIKNSGKYDDKFGQEKSRKIRAKISDATSGDKNGFYGKTHSDNSKSKMGRDVSGEKNPMFGKGHLLRGEKNGSWLGGISFGEYGQIWNESLKTEIRKRDGFQCQICRNNGYDVHHIDYVKQNCEHSNLVTLCRSCHAKTNFNREHWIEFFRSKMKEIYE